MHIWTFWFKLISTKVPNTDTGSCTLTPLLLLQQRTVCLQLTSDLTQLWPPLLVGLQQNGVPVEHWLIWLTGPGLPWTPGQPGIFGGGRCPRGSSEFSAIGLAMPPASKTEKKKQRTWIVLKCILDNDGRSYRYLDLEKPMKVSKEVIVINQCKLMSLETFSNGELCKIGSYSARIYRDASTQARKDIPTWSRCL
jgi:hypothetical protein